MPNLVEAVGQEAPTPPAVNNALKMSVYFITYDPETGTTPDESADEAPVAPFSSLRVQMNLTPEEARLMYKALRSCRAVLVETQQTDSEPDRVMLAVGCTSY